MSEKMREKKMRERFTHTYTHISHTYTHVEKQFAGVSSKKSCSLRGLWAFLLRFSHPQGADFPFSAETPSIIQLKCCLL